jgi:hypothetical protein
MCSVRIIKKKKKEYFTTRFIIYDDIEVEIVVGIGDLHFYILLSKVRALHFTKGIWLTCYDFNNSMYDVIKATIKIEFLNFLFYFIYFISPIKSF